MNLTNLNGIPLTTANELFDNIDSWTGGKLGGEYFDTYSGEALLDGALVHIYKHWSVTGPLGVYDKDYTPLATIIVKDNDAIEVIPQAPAYSMLD